MSSQQQLSSRQVTNKQVENVIQRDIVAPDRAPRVRWHSRCRVRLYRNGVQCLLFILFMVLCFVLGPSIITFMYPYVIIPFNSELEWRCRYLESYSQLDGNTLAFETNLKTSGAEVNIQVHVKDKKLSFDSIEKVLLVIDDCGFDDFKGNIVLCRPISSSEPQRKFSEYVRMAEVCYHYVRQMMSNAEITGYGRGITANVLMAAAAKLQQDYCYSFSALYAEEPIVNVRAEYEKNKWSGIAFMPRAHQDKMIEETLQEYALDEAEFGDYVENINTSILIITDYDFFGLYGHYKGVAEGKIKDMFNHMKPTIKQFHSNVVSNDYSFRHESEGYCARKRHLPLTSVMIL